VDVHGRVGRNNVTSEWIRKTDAFVERACGEAAKGASLVSCPCSKCANQKRKTKKSMVNIFARMDLRQAILGESFMVKRIVRERRC
jgi:hypothetical protein